LAKLHDVLSSQDKKDVIIQDVLWIVSMLTGMEDYGIIDELIKADIFTEIMKVLKLNNPEIHKEGLWAVINIFGYKSESYISHLVKVGIIDSLCYLLEKEDILTLKLVLDVLIAILQIRNQDSYISIFS